MRTDVDELQAGRLAAEDNPVAEDDMTGEGGVVGQHAMVADHAVVCHMDIGHQQVAVADDRLAAGGGAAVDGAAFAYDVVVADLHRGVFARELQVLRYGSNHRTGEYLAVLADACTGEDGHIGGYPSAVANLHILTDSGEIADRNVLAYLGIGMNVIQYHSVMYQLFFFI